MKYFIKLWDNEKIEIDKECFEKLEYGLWIDVCKISKTGFVSVPLKNIKLWYNVKVQPKGGK